MIYVNITKFLLISQLKKDHSMIETRHLKSVVIFRQTILWRILKPSLKNIDEVPQKSLRMAAGHIFIDISESIQHQGFLGIILSLWENFIY